MMEYLYSNVQLIPAHRNRLNVRRSPRTSKKAKYFPQISLYRFNKARLEQNVYFKLTLVVWQSLYFKI